MLRATIGNGGKRLRNRQETRAATRAGGKTAEAAIKQIASQELQAEKVRIEEWKQNVMQDVMRELQAMKQTKGEAMEAQRQSFQMELKKVREELQQVESRSMMLEDEIRSLKSQKQAPQQRPAQNTPASEKTPDATAKRQKVNNSKVVDEEEIRGSQSREDTSSPPASIHPVGKPRAEKQSYASIAMSKPAQNPEQPWTQVNHGNQKSIGKRPRSTVESEQLGRRILFSREQANEKKSKADLMLALNEALQKVGEEAHMRFSRVRYALSRAISALLTDREGKCQIGNPSTVELVDSSYKDS